MVKDIMKRIMVENDYSFENLGEKIGFTRGFLNNVDKGNVAVSKRLLEALINNFPAYKTELLESYAKEQIPEHLRKDIKISGFEKVNNKFKEQKLRVYEYDTSKDGRVDLEKYKEMMFLLEREIENESIIVEVKDRFMEPLFFEGDVLLFEPENFISWKLLNKKLVAVKYEDDFLIRKLKYRDKKPFLIPFEIDVEEDIDILMNEEKITYFGQLTDQLKRDINKITFE
jgi:transcriptional regulator with XRE-family HTH domain